jgi:hypothetical protein
MRKYFSFYYGNIVPALLKANVTPRDNIQATLSKLEARSSTTKHFQLIKAFVKSYWDIERNLLSQAYRVMRQANSIRKMEAGTMMTANVFEELFHTKFYPEHHELSREKYLTPKVSPILNDPALDHATMIDTPDNKFVKIEDTMFKACRRCSGRLIPEFAFCPYCGFDLSNFKLDLNPVVIPDVPTYSSHESHGGKMTSNDNSTEDKSIFGLKADPKFTPGGERQSKGRIFRDGKPVNVRMTNVKASNIVFEDKEVGRITDQDVATAAKGIEKFIPKG